MSQSNTTIVIVPPSAPGSLSGAVLGYDCPRARQGMVSRLRRLGYGATMFCDVSAPFAVLVGSREARRG